MRRDVTKIGGVYSAGGQLIVQERSTNSVRKKRNGLFGDPRYVVSKGQPIRGPAQRRQAEIRTRYGFNLFSYPCNSVKNRRITKKPFISHILTIEK